MGGDQLAETWIVAKGFEPGIHAQLIDRDKTRTCQQLREMGQRLVMCARKHLAACDCLEVNHCPQCICRERSLSH